MYTNQQNGTRDNVQLKWWIGVNPNSVIARLGFAILAGQEIIALTYYSMWDNIPGNGVEGKIVYFETNNRTNFDCNANNNKKFITPDSVR